MTFNKNKCPESKGSLYNPNPTQIIYDIDLSYNNKNGYHFDPCEIKQGIYMCPAFIWRNHSNFNEFVENYIHWQLCERICLESRYNNIKSKFFCRIETYCPMEVPVLLMLGFYKKNKYYLFD